MFSFSSTFPALLLPIRWPITSLLHKHVPALARQTRQLSRLGLIKCIKSKHVPVGSLSFLHPSLDRALSSHEKQVAVAGQGRHRHNILNMFRQR